MASLASQLCSHYEPTCHHWVSFYHFLSTIGHHSSTTSHHHSTIVEPIFTLSNPYQPFCLAHFHPCLTHLYPCSTHFHPCVSHFHNHIMMKQCWSARPFPGLTSWSTSSRSCWGWWSSLEPVQVWARWPLKPCYEQARELRTASRGEAGR